MTIFKKKTRPNFSHRPRLKLKKCSLIWIKIQNQTLFPKETGLKKYFYCISINYKL
jgi:hypothetical protein